jgi:atypical dual specificity phosphatase
MLRNFSWLEGEQLAGCARPDSEEALAELANRGIGLVINLHERPHDPALLARYGITELHLPVPDFTAPASEQLEQGVTAIEQALAQGKRVAVHCGAGLGRTGTLLAAYLVHQGLSPEQAIARVRAARPGSVETPEQVAAVEAYARRISPHRSQANG